MFRSRAVCLAPILIFLTGGSAEAQNGNDIVNLFGGLIRSGIATATLSAWQKLPAEELACVDQNLKTTGYSLNSAISQGIGPTDPRILNARSACRGSEPQRTVGKEPSFDCTKANYADEFAICSNVELSQLDAQGAVAYVYVRDNGGAQTARAARDRFLRVRRFCASDVYCIKQAQIGVLGDYQRLGAPNGLAPATASTHPEYVVDGLALGNKVAFESAAYRDYQCRPSDQFSGFLFCQKQRQMQETRGAYASSHTMLHAPDGTVVYINRFLEPAFFAADEAKKDVESRTKRLGNPTRLIPMPTASHVPNGMIVSWGDVSLEPIDAATTRALADGRTARVGFMIDHIGNLRRSASMDLPIYRMRGGPGYVWVASWNDRGIGTLQFLTIDPSRFSQPDSVPQLSLETSPSTARGGVPMENVRSDSMTPSETSVSTAVAERAAAAQAVADGAKADAERARTAARPAQELAQQAGTGRRKGETSAAPNVYEKINRLKEEEKQREEAERQRTLDAEQKERAELLKSFHEDLARARPSGSGSGQSYMELFKKGVSFTAEFIRRSGVAEMVIAKDWGSKTFTAEEIGSVAPMNFARAFVSQNAFDMTIDACLLTLRTVTPEASVQRQWDGNLKQNSILSEKRIYDLGTLFASEAEQRLKKRDSLVRLESGKVSKRFHTTDSVHAISLPIQGIRLSQTSQGWRVVDRSNSLELFLDERVYSSEQVRQAIKELMLDCQQPYKEIPH